LYDWLGSSRMRTLTSKMRAAGVHVRVFNPRVSTARSLVHARPRKTIAVDGKVGFVSGLCASERWLGKSGQGARAVARHRHRAARAGGCGNRARGRAGVGRCGEPLPPQHLTPNRKCSTSVIPGCAWIAGVPSGGVDVPPRSRRRVDRAQAAVADRRVLRRDVRLRAGAARRGEGRRRRAAAGAGRERHPGAVAVVARAVPPLLESALRVFEWDGTMLHAKTAVADGLWARVGSTNLNLASWMTNYELDVAIEDTTFAGTMAKQFEQRPVPRDRDRADVAQSRARSRTSGATLTQTRGAPGRRASMSGSANRARCGAVSVGSALGAALTNRRSLGPPKPGCCSSWRPSSSLSASCRRSGRACWHGRCVRLAVARRGVGTQGNCIAPECAPDDAGARCRRGLACGGGKQG
jgi:cardiolipin synthase